MNMNEVRVTTRDEWEPQAVEFFKEHAHLNWFFRYGYPGETHELIHKGGAIQRLTEALVREEEEINICVFNLWPGSVYRFPVVVNLDGSHSFRDVNQDGATIHEFPWNILQIVRHFTKKGTQI